MKQVRAAALLVLGLLLVFCGCSPETGRASSSSSVKKSEGLVVSLTASPVEAVIGREVSLTLTVKNVSAESRAFELPSSQTFDFAAYNRDGGLVWRFSEGALFAQAATRVTIESGSAEVYKAGWDTSNTTPGSYTVEGYFLGLVEMRPWTNIELVEREPG